MMGIRKVIENSVLDLNGSIGAYNSPLTAFSNPTPYKVSFLRTAYRE